MINNTTTGRLHRLTDAEKRYIAKAVQLRARLSNKALAQKMGVSALTIKHAARASLIQQRRCRNVITYQPKRIGRPRALSVEQEQRVIALISQTSRNHRGRVYAILQRETGAGRATLQRAYREHQRKVSMQYGATRQTSVINIGSV